MSTTTNGFLYFTRLFARVQSSIGAAIKIKSISGFCILFVFAAIMNAGSANANILTTLSGTEAKVTNNTFQPQIFEAGCGLFAYVQRMLINGKVEMVKTEFVYQVGTYTLTFYGTCGGYNLYGLGTCACKRPDFKFKSTVSLKGILTVATVKIETAPHEVFFTGLIQSMVAPGPAGFLWIRKDDKRIHQSYKSSKNV